MDRSERYNFYLPSSDTDDLADINQISENFRIIDERMPSKEDLGDIDFDVDQTYNPESENAQSGISVAEAIKQFKSYTDNNFAPVIKQTASGNVISVNDVSPIEHELKVKAKSKDNLLPYPYTENFPQTIDEVTIDLAEDGLGIVVSGVLPAGAYHMLNIAKITLPAGTYRSKVFSEYNGVLYIIALEGVTSSQEPNTYTLYTEQTVTLELIIHNRVLDNAVEVLDTIYPMLVEGTKEPTEYVSPIVEGVEVKRLGKNLFDGAFELGSIHGDTGEDLENHGGGKYLRNVGYIPVVPNSTYTMTNPIYAVNEKIRFYDENLGYVGNKVASGENFIPKHGNLIRTGVIPSNAYYMRIEVDCSDVNTATSIMNGELKYQFELGSKGTKYEPYTEPQTATATADGTVNGLTSLSPSITLLTDSDVILECEYNTDTKMYIDNKFAELSAAILNS